RDKSDDGEPRSVDWRRLHLHALSGDRSGAARQQRGLPEIETPGSHGAAQPFRIVRAGARDGARHARRRGARAGHALVRRPSGAVPSTARFDGARTPDDARADEPGTADVRAVQQAREQLRHSCQEASARADLRQAVRDRIEEVPRRDSQAGDDRVQIQMSHAAGLPLALTLGEPAGIGPDLTLAVWQRRRELAIPPFYVIGDPEFLAARARALGNDVPVRSVTPRQASNVFSSALPVVPLDARITAAPGRPDDSSAAGAIASIDRAVADVMAGEAGAVVTNPIAKSVLYRAGFTDPGHTEYLARLAERATGRPVMPVMMLWSPELAVVPVTIHVSLKDAIAQLSTRLIVDTGRIVARDMTARFGIARPR